MVCIEDLAVPRDFQTCVATGSFRATRDVNNPPSSLKVCAVNMDHIPVPTNASLMHCGDDGWFIRILWQSPAASKQAASPQHDKQGVPYALSLHN